jgi:adenosylcobinamide-GDP ribazoletransferase
VLDFININIGLNIVLALIMFGLGLSLSPSDFRHLFNQPRALAVGLVARAKIGGQTGDILGASQQISEVVVLTLVAAALQT